jgi:hypothetical protein
LGALHLLRDDLRPEAEQADWSQALGLLGLLRPMAEESVLGG